jgi:hypothetical protein
MLTVAACPQAQAPSHRRDVLRNSDRRYQVQGMHAKYDAVDAVSDL